jgi:hypothetical protein
MRLPGRKAQRHRRRLLVVEQLETRSLLCVTVGPDGQVVADADGDFTVGSPPGPARINRQSVQSGAINRDMLHLGASRFSPVGGFQSRREAVHLLSGCVAWPPNG